MKTTLFSFNTIEERDEFVKFVSKSDYAHIIQSIKYDPVVLSDKELAAIFIGEQKLAEGTLESMNARFVSELSIHKAPMSLKKRINDKWVVIRTRLA